MKIIQELMNIFDFVKLGSYQENCDGLNEKTALDNFSLLHSITGCNQGT
ncbi:MAG: hypothetical protein IKY41_08120 [Clostridia bacterium]|nr:hypothetical protein [Clostridia bacterium]